MSQADIYEYLQANEGKWITVKELSEQLNIRPESIQTNIKKLLKFQYIYIKRNVRGKTLNIIYSPPREEEDNVIRQTEI